ncbi:AsmA family protein [Cellvibrio sp. OA-2007]|uniref:AsmA family protein n=1 Tax=Cellvibrio sp. OA-2007 TaxID=529823 RepID=UPI000A000252|nr:AsmA family protein [Cellvibrio sp. OA-2007]
MKIALKTLAVLVALVLVAVLALVFLVDANRFKPRIEALAQEQGVALQINGDLGWKLWPSIGVAVADVSVAALDTPAQPIAQLRQASLLLALMPLFSGDFQVDHILLDGAKVNLAVDTKGKGNWESLTQSKNNTKASAPAATDAGEVSLKLTVERISLVDSAVDYADAKSGQNIALHDINLTLTDVNTQGKPFALDLAFALALTPADTPPLALKGRVQNRITLDEKLTRISLDEGELQLQADGKSSAKLALSYSMNLTDVQQNLAYQGQLKVEDTNARDWLAVLGTELETANKSALSKVSLSSNLAGDSNKVTFDKVNFQLDNTRFSGSLAVTDFATSAIKLVLQGDSLNLDDYLPPPAPESANAPAQTASEDVPLPLDALRGLNLDAQIKLESLRYNNLQLDNIALGIKAKKGIIDQTLTARSYEGDIKFTSNTDARGNQAALKFDGNVKGVELEPLMKALEVDEKLGLSGAIQAQTQGTAQGASVNQLMASMNSTAAFSGAQVRLSPLNIEEQFCKLVNLVTQNPAEVSWDDFTELRQLDGNLVWRDQVITLSSFNAGVSQLLLASTGVINLLTDKYEFKLPLKLADASAAASMKGCSLSTTNYWVDRSLSLLRCKGSLAAIDPLKDCGFDKSALTSLTKDFAEYKLREKHGAKIDAAEQKLEEKKQEAKAQVEEKKQELINKLQNKLFKTPKSAAAASVAAEAATPATETAPEEAAPADASESPAAE